MYTKLKLIFALLSLCVLLGGCVQRYYAPDSGTWYCEELQAQFIASEPDDFYPLNNDESGIYVIVDGDKIAAAIDLQMYSKHFAIVCQESNNQKYDLGEVIYAFEVVRLDDSEYVLKDEEGKEYTFVRTD